MCGHIEKYDAGKFHDLGFSRGHSHHLTSHPLRQLG